MGSGGPIERCNNGSLRSPRQEAREALQALISGSKARLEAASASPKKSLSTGMGEPCEQAGAALRSLFKADIEKALGPKTSSKRLADLEGQVSKLLEQVSKAPRVPVSIVQEGPPKLTIVSARGLRDADWLPGTGKSDPYCICEIQGKPNAPKIKTEVINDNLDPVWNHEAFLAEYTPGDSLVFHIYDKDWGKRDDFLGTCVLAGDRIDPAGFEGELRLADAGKGVEAFLKIKVAYAAAAPPLTPTQTQQAPQMRSKPPKSEASSQTEGTPASVLALAANEHLSSRLLANAGHAGYGSHAGVFAIHAPPAPDPKRQRSLVVKGEGQVAKALRVQVQDARSRLHNLDKEVTSLTHELRRSRTSKWAQQREHSSTEAQLESLLKERRSAISLESLQEEERLRRQETQLTHELGEVRWSIVRWSQVVKRQDAMVQQHRDARPDPQRILAKHPAGEIFWPSNLPADTDSEDGYDEGPRRGAWNRAGEQEDISLGSSDEDEPPSHNGYSYGSGEAGATVRSGPRPPLGVESEKEEDSAESCGSSLPSPSGGDAASSGSGGGRSPTGGRGGPLLGSVPAQDLVDGRRRAGRARSSSSESTSDDDSPTWQGRTRGGLSMASLAGRALMETAKRHEGGNRVPPLPDVGRGRAFGCEDEAQEVSSEEDFEAETSRSV